ncbi:DEAD/DEAH box helicase [Phaeodactylibacter luteus]|uniref:DEAD-box ATP-dependent RNA helicase RhpA n=1 Tax=Phaeodactylibacter luteus TaxID=1564516 RepID=A0A5C6RGN0_9BACT|nr:DEAD/DEAH box helicase [Phaeodactylibacter luteus]TXB61451.1 DEAD/DEAH box helicase [Phaeodactylibacter luteus]
MTFKDLGLSAPILKALDRIGYQKPTPIQEQAIPILLQGHDLLGCAQTGTGKTAAFSLPIIQQLMQTPPHRGQRPVRALIIAPTRELAIQIDESIGDYAKDTPLRHAVIFGGVKQNAQVNAIKRGVDILTATPGRLLDLMSQGFVSLDKVEVSVLDEADHMLDMGFIHDIKRIVARLPEDRQSLFFSATMSPEIMALSKRILGQPKRVTINPEQPTAERVEQAVYFVSKQEKRKLLAHLLDTETVDSALIFSRTKHGADRIARQLNKAGHKSAAIHGNKSQNARQRVLDQFKNGELNVLVATDIAARGIDVDELSHVINYDLPNVPETYVHRIGRTGRAKASGVALSFCDGEERAYLKDIQKLIGQRVPVIDEHPFPDDGSLPEPTPQPQGGQNNRNRSGQGGNKNGRRPNNRRNNSRRAKSSPSKA